MHFIIFDEVLPWVDSSSFIFEIQVLQIGFASVISNEPRVLPG